jgi:hypothetical protein
MLIGKGQSGGQISTMTLGVHQTFPSWGRIKQQFVPQKI